MPARQTARKVLMLCRTRGAWSDAVLREQIEAAGLDRKDAALCTTLCCGVLQNRALLDFSRVGSICSPPFGISCGWRSIRSPCWIVCRMPLR